MANMAVGEDVEKETLLLDDGELSPSLASRHARTSGWLWAMHLTLLSVSLTMLISGLRNMRQINCVEKHSMSSPALGVVKEEYQLTRFNGSFYGPSPYRGMPTPEIDAAWANLVEVGVFSMSHSDLMKAGSLESSVALPKEIGGGYAASLEVNHQIHCVHSYKEYYQTHDLWSKITGGDSDETFRVHLDHCADLLRQKLMCDADVGVIAFNWVTNRTRAFPNFSTLHKCRNFDDVLRWAKDRQVPQPRQKYTQPAGAVALPFPP